MAKFKRQHYVSKFYLKGFVDPDEDPNFWMYDKKRSDEDARLVSPTDSAVQTYYYAFEKEDGTFDRHTYETGFQQMEDIIAPSIKKILERIPYNNMERGHVSTYMALSMLRVPNFRDNIKKNIESHHKARAMFMAKNEEIFKSQMSTIAAEHGEDLGNLDDLREDFMEGKYTIEIDQYQSLGILNNSLMPLAETVHKFYWHFLEAPPNRKFITCDNPLFYLNPLKKLYEQEEVGIWTDGTEVTFPLSKNIAIFATKKLRADRYVNVDANKVDEINRRTIISANRFVYGSKPSKLIARLVHKYRYVRPVLIEEYFEKKNGFTTKQTRQIINEEPLVE